MADRTSGIGRGSLGEAKTGEVPGGEGGDARRGSACGPRGETRPCGPALDERKPADAGEGVVAPRWRTGGARPEDGRRATPPKQEAQMSGNGPWGKDHTQPR
ncbi:hypothetical protein NDU88_007494 [Pleurodeles waltl]|uniref:Uncharacterized protein n=1 Tax=Pleurodeles waltl TaxID=8319 RepID=A0AAV7QN86_PLEWA|nr:hypothetical protein NDU88_007494 [Pleurodeles waltl]